MKTYTIKQNDYVVSQAKGKHNAIKHVQNMLAWNGTVPDDVEWGKFKLGKMDIFVHGTACEQKYTIEEKA